MQLRFAGFRRVAKQNRVIAEHLGDFHFESFSTIGTSLIWYFSTRRSFSFRRTRFKYPTTDQQMANVYG